MKDFSIWLLITLIVAAGTVGLSYAFGFIGVHQTKTIGKAQENARREVFEQTQSYVGGKIQELSKLKHEWNRSDEDGKITIESIVRSNFANFDETNIQDPNLYSFLQLVRSK
jgi:hypothetical protein